jgi:hypothetical protein
VALERNGRIYHRPTWGDYSDGRTEPASGSERGLFAAMGVAIVGFIVVLGIERVAQGTR